MRENRWMITTNIDDISDSSTRCIKDMTANHVWFARKKNKFFIFLLGQEKEGIEWRVGSLATNFTTPNQLCDVLRMRSLDSTPPASHQASTIDTQKLGGKTFSRFSWKNASVLGGWLVSSQVNGYERNVDLMDRITVKNMKPSKKP